MSFEVLLKIRRSLDSEPVSIRVPLGKKLRKILLEHHLSPYQREKKIFNCRGMGICGTCKVLVLENGQWWERRSCQIQCFHEMEIQLK
ncbi:MAG: hypothetical protein EBQ85_05440 [Proteobacteria bacterium]|nr:hypothetical protein [Pseudomonadota bacterium]